VDKGSLPLLEPRGVLYSSSFYFNFPRIWTDRAKLFPKIQADGITAFDKSCRPISGRREDEQAAGVGGFPITAFVAVKQPKSSYAKQPATRSIPAFRLHHRDAPAGQVRPGDGNGLARRGVVHVQPVSAENGRTDTQGIRDRPATASTRRPS